MAEKKTSAPSGWKPCIHKALTPVMIKFSWEFPATLKIRIGLRFAGINVTKAAMANAHAAIIVRPGRSDFTCSPQRPQQRYSWFPKTRSRNEAWQRGQ